MTVATKKEYSLTLVLGDKTYESSGDTMLQALKSLPKPHKNMSKGVLTIKRKKNVRVIDMTPSKIKRLSFIGDRMLEVVAKQLSVDL